MRFVYLGVGIILADTPLILYFLASFQALRWPFLSFGKLTINWPAATLGCR